MFLYPVELQTCRAHRERKVALIAIWYVGKEGGDLTLTMSAALTDLTVSKHTKRSYTNILHQGGNLE